MKIKKNGDWEISSTEYNNNGCDGRNNRENNGGGWGGWRLWWWWSKEELPKSTKRQGTKTEKK